MFRIFSPEWSGRLSVPRWLRWLIVIGALFALEPVFYIGVYNHPCPADDYQNAYWQSFFGAQKDLYLHWSGRYFNNLAVSLCPLHWRSFFAFRATVILIMLAFALAFLWAVMRGLRVFAGISYSSRWAIGAATTALLFNNFPSLSEGFFWYSGEVTYVLPAVAALCLLGVLMRVNEDAAPGAGTLLIAAILAAISIGGNEILLMLCDVVVLFGWLYYKRKGKVAQRRFYVRLAIVCISCTALSLFAPGNLIRQHVNPRNVAMVPPTWLYFSQKAFFQWITNPYFLLCSALVLLLLNGQTLIRPRLHLFAAFLLPFITVLVLSFPAHYALGTPPPPRVMNMVYTFFLLSWLVFLLHLHLYFRERIGADGVNHALLRQLVIIAVMLLLLGSINTHDLRQANLFAVPKSLVRGIPQGFNRELTDRYQQIAATGDTARVAPLRFRDGNPLYIMDIVPRPTVTGGQYGRYWGAKMVVIDTASRAGRP